MAMLKAFISMVKDSKKNGHDRVEVSMEVALQMVKEIESLQNQTVDKQELLEYLEEILDKEERLMNGAPVESSTWDFHEGSTTWIGIIKEHVEENTIGKYMERREIMRKFNEMKAGNE